MSRYLDWLFDGVEIAGKDVLDIGGGSGWVSLYCSLRNARSVTLIEPFGAGSNGTMLGQLTRGMRTLGAANVSVVHASFPCDGLDGEFDVLVLQNSINHLSEDDVVRLKHDDRSRRRYAGYFSEMRRLARPGAHLLIADCSDRNFFADLRLPHPISRSIDWKKHQDPATWLELLDDAGFSKVSVTWSAYKRSGRLGWLLTSNAAAAYVLTSHFRLHLRRAPAERDPSAERGR